MARADIGLIKCPICAMSGAHVRETEKHRAYILCEECNVQIFARGTESDKAIRAAMKPSAGNVTGIMLAQKNTTAPECEVEAEAEESTIFDYILPKKRVAK